MSTITTTDSDRRPVPGAAASDADTATQIRPRYGRIADAVAYSGLSASSIRRLLRDRRLTPHKVPGLGVVLIDLAELQELIQPAE